MSNLFLVGTITLVGLSACKKEPSGPVPCYGVIPVEYCDKQDVAGEAMMTPSEEQIVLNYED